MAMAADANGEQLILATGGYDHTIKLWQAHTGVCLRTLQHLDSQVNALDITPNRTMLVACGYQHVRLYDMQSNNPIVNFDGVSKNVVRVGFQEHGRFMFTGGEDCRVRIYDMMSQSPNCNRVFDCLSTPINGLCLNPNQIEMAIGCQDGGVYLWDIRSGTHDQLKPEVDASIQDIAISPDGKLMAAINNKGNCYIWNVKTGEQALSIIQPRMKVEVHKRYALRCKFSPDSSLFVTTSADGTARVWKTSDFSLWRELKSESKSSNKKTVPWIWDATFSADSRYLFTASSDGLARLWKFETRDIEREYVGHQKAITAIAFRDVVCN